MCFLSPLVFITLLDSGLGHSDHFVYRTLCQINIFFLYELPNKVFANINVTGPLLMFESKIKQNAAEVDYFFSTSLTAYHDLLVSRCVAKSSSTQPHNLFGFSLFCQCVHYQVWSLVAPMPHLALQEFWQNSQKLIGSSSVQIHNLAR